MKQYLEKLLAAVLCITLCAGMCLHTMAANENNKSGIEFNVTLNRETIQESSEDQTVVMYLTATEEVTVDGIGFTVTKDDPLTIASVTGGEQIGDFSAALTNLETGKAGWSAWLNGNNANIEGVTELAVITFTVPGGTQAGTYNVGVNGLELTKNQDDIWEDAASASTTLTIIEPVSGYSAGISSTTTDVSVNDQVSVNVAVNHAEDTYFATGELVLSYDSTKLEFVKCTTAAGKEVTANADAGTLTLEDYGVDKAVGNSAYVLTFKAIKDSEATVTLTSAAFLNKEGASQSDLLPAVIMGSEVKVNIAKEKFAVTLPTDGILIGSEEVVSGADYTFSVENVNYVYDLSATMNGASAIIVNNDDGTYTIKNVTGELVITGSRTPKSFGVSFSGNAKDDIENKVITATYNTAYSFTMPSAEGWGYSLDSITIGGVAYNGYSVENSVYTIPGTAITGDIVITVSKSQTEANVIVEGSGAGAAAGYASKAEIGEDYTLTISPEDGYTYTITATMGGVKVTDADTEANTFTITEVNGNIVFTVERSVITDGVSVSDKEYLKVDGLVMWLVTNTTVADGKVPTYNGNKMFWSEEYNAYCYLVIADMLTEETAKAQIAIADGSATAVDYGMDVNMTNKVDASDAQLAYNMYNAVYSDFTTVPMEKFLRADVNGDGMINVNDATAIITKILDSQNN